MLWGGLSALLKNSEQKSKPLVSQSCDLSQQDELGYPERILSADLVRISSHIHILVP